MDGELDVQGHSYYKASQSGPASPPMTARPKPLTRLEQHGQRVSAHMPQRPQHVPAAVEHSPEGLTAQARV